MFHWGLNDSPGCVFGKPQTAQHMINYCSVTPKEVALAHSNEATLQWF